MPQPIVPQLSRMSHNIREVKFICRMCKEEKVALTKGRAFCDDCRLIRTQLRNNLTVEREGDEHFIRAQLREIRTAIHRIEVRLDHR